MSCLYTEGGVLPGFRRGATYSAGGAGGAGGGISLSAMAIFMAKSV